MTRAAALALCAVATFPGMAAADLPTAGTCVRNVTSATGYVERTTLAWSDQGAVIGLTIGEVEGRLHGLRAHDEGFKLSVLFEHEYLGPSEMVLFSVFLRGKQRYRIGWISYDELEGGGRAVATMNAFADADCEITF
ncbi:hypothetical protein [Vannielia litorea]|uniref:hypothetical protein n=2 Tax=Vannielia litorea TaxID=1217970 RepID=UPI001C957C9E|nr:hypothetical protein [Vannielia litorea]MBY6076024.1 hypothetical protein [Vannielia litorea]